MKNILLFFLTAVLFHSISNAAITVDSKDISIDYNKVMGTDHKIYVKIGSAAYTIEASIPGKEALIADRVGQRMEAVINAFKLKAQNTGKPVYIKFAPELWPNTYKTNANGFLSETDLNNMIPSIFSEVSSYDVGLEAKLKELEQRISDIESKVK